MRIQLILRIILQQYIHNLIPGPVIYYSCIRQKKYLRTHWRAGRHPGDDHHSPYFKGIDYFHPFINTGKALCKCNYLPFDGLAY